MVNYFTNSPNQTKKLGEILAKEILRTSFKKRAFVIGLIGDLGGGKTTFLKGFARGLGIKEKILSPTFVIIKRFKIKDLRLQPAHHPPRSRRGPFMYFYHIDCYRIKNEKEILDLGLKEIIQNPKNIVTIEWAERVKKVLPKNTIWIKFKFIDVKTRQILIK